MKGLILTLGLAYGGSVAALFRPYWGLLIYVFFGLTKPESIWGYAVPRWNYSRTIAIALLIGWALAGFGKWNFGRARAIVVAFICFWVWMTVSSVGVAEPDRAWREVEGLFKILLPFVVGMTLIESVSQLKQLAWVILLTQGFLAYEVNLGYFTGTLNRESMYGGLDNNGVAITMVTSLGLAIFLGLQAKAWWQKGVAVASAGLMIHVILLSFSRGGMVSLLITGAFSFFLIPKKLGHYLLLLVVVLLALRMAGPQVRERFQTVFASQGERDGSAQERVDHWNGCFASMRTHPFGVGTAQWPVVCEQYPGLRYGRMAHSTWLQNGAELGFPGLLCLVLFYGLGMKRLWPITRGRQAVPDPWLTYMARMVIAALAGYIVSAQFVSVMGVELPYYIVLIGAGVLKVASTQSLVSEEDRGRADPASATPVVDYFCTDFRQVAAAPGDH